jgi:hypothetical protein
MELTQVVPYVRGGTEQLNGFGFSVVAEPSGDERPAPQAQSAEAPGPMHDADRADLMMTRLGRHVGPLACAQAHTPMTHTCPQPEMGPNPLVKIVLRVAR